MPEGDPTEQKKYAISIGDVPAIVGGVSATSLLLSATHEWAYFDVIGSKYQSLMTITDYFGAAVEWLPAVILMMVFATIIGLFGVAASMTLAGSETTRFKWGFTAGAATPIVTIAAYSSLFLPSYDLSASFGVAAAAAVLLIMLIVIWRPHLTNALTKRHLGAFSLGMIVVAPCMFAVAYLLGLNSAYDDMRTPSHVFAVATVEHPTTRPVIVLRDLQNGILIRLPAANRNEFVRWEDVKGLSNLSFEPPPYSRSCMWFGFLCSGKVETVEP
jgi:hypothetical protein